MILSLLLKLTWANLLATFAKSRTFLEGKVVGVGSGQERKKYGDEFDALIIVN